MDANQFESNSNKHKLERRVKPEKERFEAVATGRTIRKSLGKRFIKTFFTEDIKDVKGYLIFDVLIPAIKDTLFNMLNGGASMLFYGEDRKPNGKRRGTYTAYSEVRDRPVRTTSFSQSGRRRVMNDFDDIALDSRSDCERVLDAMNESIEIYGSVSVADLYDFVGMSRESEFTDNKFGWVDITTAGYSRRRDGSYVLDLPKVVDLK